VAAVVGVGSCAVACIIVPAASAGVLAFGLNLGGRTGVGTFEGHTPIATPIVATNLSGRRITQSAAGNFHSLVLANDGAVFSFGEGDYGETGLGIGDDVSVATPIVTTNLGGRKIKQIAAGHALSLLLADDGSVFSFGRNHFGQLGLGSVGGTSSIATPIDATNLGGRKITQVAAGEWYGLLLADDGSVFSMGYNDYGRTGLGVASAETPIATPINATNLGSRKITQVAAGADFSLLLADDGSVFSFGSNAAGRLGQGTAGGFTSIATAIDVTNLGGRKITQIAAGSAHSLLLADDGSAFAFGVAINGQLGIGLPPAGFVASATPIDMTNLGGQKATQLSAGSHHSLMLAENGQVFSFGANSAGQLGIGFGTGIGASAVPISINETNLVGQIVTHVEAHLTTNLLITAPALPGDFDFNGAVDGRDFLAWQRDPGVGDLADWRENFGMSSLGAGQTAVPEPPIATLVFALAGALAMIRRSHCDVYGRTVA
jgi:alpha-tubulin suppressor-like RCC1 family protein